MSSGWRLSRTVEGRACMCSIHRDQSTWLHPIAPQLLYVNTGKLVEEELTKQELQMRQASALSGVPMYLIESGKWKNSSYIDPATQTEYSPEQTRAKVVNAVKIMKDRKR